MKLLITSPAKALNKAYLKQSLKREQIDHFKDTLGRLFERIQKADESEEHLKNIISEFLKDTWYKHTNEVNTSGRADLVIYNGTTATSSVGVLIEVKRPSNKNEMISPDRPNAKALHELLHYYMQERYIKDNTEIRHLIICNIHEWYIFDAVDFERFFFHNQKLVNSYKGWKEGTLPGMDTAWFYQVIAKPFIDDELEELPCTYFNLKEFEKIVRSKAKTEDTKLLSLYKILSPAHLLKQSVSNDSNSLNKEFYSELLHIIGLEEVRGAGKKLIQRKPEGRRNEGSVLENTVAYLKARNRLNYLSTKEQYGATSEDQYFGIALELCITWLNRILFLKLLEGQLIAYQKGDRSYAFLSIDRIKDYDDLNELFFDVLAVKVPDRGTEVQSKFSKIPYLNSSLFEESDLERSMMQINELKNKSELPLLGQTVLKTTVGKRRTGNVNTLSYLFEFLDAYDFGAEGTTDIQEQNKTIINASVLGLIFEKINGYKDGSFFTPGFITMYICRETIRRAVVKKFNEVYTWSCETITDLHNEIYRHKVPVPEANSLIKELRICDPAVGSGHFLVSALNELIAVKSELKILAGEDGKLLRCDVTIENDELIVTVDDHIFEYNFRDSESQRIQETIFHEKETIVENCLFGVDINPKSVAICRLRLWIEMLKNAYYRKGGEVLETLPNIDINIKCGNSLISRFSLSGNTKLKAASKSKLKEMTDKYRKLVVEYKASPADKIKVRQDIEALKHQLENFGLPNDKDFLTLREGREQLSVQSLFGYSKKELAVRKLLQKKMDALQIRFDEKQIIYRNAFEWRFEFPEALDEEGNFVGFDAIIGNPPYIRIQDLKETSPSDVSFLKERYVSSEKGNYDIYVVFMELGISLLNSQGRLSYILPHKFFNSQYGESVRKLVANGGHLSEIIHFGHEMIFDEATTYTCILSMDKQRNDRFRFVKVADVKGWTRSLTGSSTETLIPTNTVGAAEWNFTLGDDTALLGKLSSMKDTLETVTSRIFQGLKTSADRIYIVNELERANGTVRIFSPEKQKEYWLEEELLHPLIKGGDSCAYCMTATDRLILFPYEVGDSLKGELLSAEQLQRRFPLTWDYLCDNQEYLQNREHGKMNTDGWYGFGRVQALDVISMPKIFTPDLAPEPRFSLDFTGEHFFTGGAAGGYGILVKEGFDRRYILAILNSRLAEWFINQTATQMRGGWRSYESRFIKHIPIHPVDIDNVDEMEKHDRIVELVDNLLIDATSSKVPELKSEINHLIYDLYDIKDKGQIEIIEGSTAV